MIGVYTVEPEQVEAVLRRLFPDQGIFWK